MRDKLIELLVKSHLVDEPEDLADYLIARGVTLATDTNVGDKTPLSNGDRIRAMTDYELAEFMSGKIVDQRFLCDSENGNELSIGEQMAVRHNHFCTWNKWLKQPAEED